MAEFNFPTDVANRALQRVGQPPISLTLGFADGTKRAGECGACYGKLRRAELQANVWRFATRKTAIRAVDSNTLLLAPTLWSSTVAYFVGSIVTDAAGTYWQSRIPDNKGNQPGQSFAAWEPYFGPLTVSLYDSSASYYSGELVYKAPGDGTYSVFQAQASGVSSDPAVADAWAATATYRKDSIVQGSNATLYLSLIALNIANDPTTAAAPWAAGTTYALNAVVAGSDGYNYTSLQNGNVGHDPSSNGNPTWWHQGGFTAWTTSFVGGGNAQWLQIGGAAFPNGTGLAGLRIIWPLGTGPVSQTSTRNIYRLPANYLRRAPQDPAAGRSSIEGAPTNELMNDWEFDGDYLVSWSSGVIILRFVADVQDVSQFNDKFCEALARCIAWEVCEPLTQSTAKIDDIRAENRVKIEEAKLSNAIDMEGDEQPLDDWLACRA